MGYTHYWKFGYFVKEKNYRQYKTALRECRKIIRSSPVSLANWNGEGKPTLDSGFNFNGSTDAMCENFGMFIAPDREPDRDNWFCKTNEEPYDAVVVACLCVLEDRLGEAFKARSDGDPHEWEDGKALASKVLGREIKLPQQVRDQVTKYGWAARMYREKHPEYDYTPLDVSHPDHASESVPEYAKSSN